jgi:pheromone shutdown-related protein TraB
MTGPFPEAGAVSRVDLPEKTIHLIGTAHVSRRSVEEVCRSLQELAPDCVCVELDRQRLRALREPNQWNELDIVSAIRKGNGAFLLASLALSAFQRRLGMRTGVRPGAELLAAVEAAEARGIPAELVDRPIRTTLLRVWRRMGFWGKAKLLSAVLASAFENPRVEEEELAKMREKDTLSALLEEVGNVLPAAKEVLIDERDVYMAAKIRQAPGRVTAAVVGAGHVAGLTAALRSGTPADLEILESVPPKSVLSGLIQWALPLTVLALFAVGFFAGDRAKLAEVAWAWFLATGALSAFGALVALGHPLSVLSAFLAAPMTTLNPALAAGMISGVVQAWASKPRVRDMEGLLEDLGHWRGWWRNRLSRVLLVFLFSNAGAGAGTLVALLWLKDLI